MRILAATSVQSCCTLSIPASYHIFVSVIPFPKSAQINHTYSKSTPTHIHHHYAPFVTPTNTTHIISTAPTYAPRCHPWWPDGRRSWLVYHKREYRSPLARLKGVGRQQQHIILPHYKVNVDIEFFKLWSHC